MSRFIQRFSDPLRKQVLQKAGIKTLNPSDCKHLSEQVFRQTSKSVSETTLKRLFGFAYSSFNPSAFTLNALSEFCGYTGWQDFCDKAEVPEDPVNETPGWRQIASSALRLSRTTLEIVKGRSGIPFDKTIRREFLDEHMAAFLDGDYPATVFSGPADYGKTIALAHWVSSMLDRNPLKKDIIVFASGTSLLYHSGELQRLSAWLGSLFPAVPDAKAAPGAFAGRFILILDGVDQFGSPSQRDEMLEQVLDLINLYKGQPRLKIVVSLRSFTWANSRLREQARRQGWFEGQTSEGTPGINVPLLNRDEILQIASGLSSEPQDSPPASLLPYLSYPLCLQYHYQSHEKEFTLNSLSEFHIFQVVSAYFLDRVYRDNQSQDILFLVSNLIDELDLSANDLSVPRVRVNSLIRHYQDAYQHLVSSGFLQEVNVSDSLNYGSEIRFVHRLTVTRMIARKLIAQNNGLFDRVLISRYNSISNQFIGKEEVLKWCVFLTAMGMKPCNLKLLGQTRLSIREKSNLIILFSDILRNLKDRVATEQDQQNMVTMMCGLDDFFGIEYIQKGYEHALKTILATGMLNKYGVMIRTCLGMIAIMRLDLGKLEEQIAIIRDEAANLHEFAINPLECLQTIYSFLKYGTLREDSLHSLLGYFSNPVEPCSERYPKSFHEVMYLLSLYTLQICNKRSHLLLVMNRLAAVHPKGSPGYNFLFGILRAEALLAGGCRDEALLVYADLKASWILKERDFTSFMRVSFIALEAKLELPENAGEKTVLSPLAQLCEDEPYHLPKVQSLAYLAISSSASPHTREFARRFYMEFCRTARASGIRAESFVENLGGNLASIGFSISSILYF